MRLVAGTLAAAMLAFVGSSTAYASPLTLVGDQVLFQGCAFVPLFPTDCTGSPFFKEQATIVTPDATDLFTFGAMTTNVQDSSIVVTLGPGAAKGAFFNGTLVRGIDWVGSPLEA